MGSRPIYANFRYMCTFSIGFFIGALLLMLLGGKTVPIMRLDSNVFREVHNYDEVGSLDKQILLSHTEDSPATIVDDVSQDHFDDTTLADKLFREVKVLCWVMTSPKTMHIKGVAVMNTWGKRCNKFLFASDYNVGDLPTMNISVEPGREHLTSKTMQAFDYVHKHYKDDYDWFLKADDDTYVIVENLRYLLSAHSPKEKIFFGHHFTFPVQQGYFSGGAGYVISKEALTLYSQRLDNQCISDGGAEDVNFGLCMENLGVTPGESTDSLGRVRFHCSKLSPIIDKKMPAWTMQRTKYRDIYMKGQDSISDYTISSHYAKPNDVFLYDLFIYQVRPYGIITYPKDLNGQKERKTSIRL